MTTDSDKTIVCDFDSSYNIEKTVKKQETSPEHYTGNYSLKGKVGAGGVGQVLLGFDENIGREVAIKELLPDIKETKEGKKIVSRFIKEAKITGKLQHPNIVPVYEIGQKPDGTNFYVMKNVKGRTLSQAIKETEEIKDKRQAFQERLKLVDNLIDVCEAMGFAHSKDVVHRDLKPSNIIIGEHGETVLLDWGLAKICKEDENNKSNIEENQEELTQQGEILGTPAYMAPEQVSSSFGQDDVDLRTDVYALGSILYHILTGKTAYSGKIQEILSALLSNNPIKEPKTQAGKIPVELTTICKKAMEKDKNKRYKNAMEMAKDLKAFQQGSLIKAHTYTKKELFIRFVRKNKIAVLAGTIALVAIILGGVFSVYFGMQAKRAEKTAQQALKIVTNNADEAFVVSERAKELLVNFFKDSETALQKRGFEISNELKNKSNILKDLVESKSYIKSAYFIDDNDTSYFYGNGLIKKYENLIKETIQTRKTSFSRIGKDYKNHHMFVFATPIKEKQSSIAVLINSEEFAQKIFKQFINSKTSVWVMQDDGYIVFDETVSELGLNLFSSNEYKQYKDLKNFGRLVQGKEYGIGHYIFNSDEKKNKIVHKIGAWHRYQINKDTGWSVIVIKTFDQ